MKILFISEYYPPQIKGGGEINLKTLAATLVKQKVEVVVLTSRFEGLPEYEEVEGVKVYRRLRTGKDPGSWSSNVVRSLMFPLSVAKEAKRLIQEINPEVLHFIGISIIAAPKLSYLNKLLCATIESYPTLCPKGDRWYHGKEECKIICNFREFSSCQKDSDEIGKMKNRWYLKFNPLFLGYTYHYYKRLHKALSHCTLISISRYVQQLLLLHGHQSTVIPNILDLGSFSAAKKNIKAEKEDTKVQKMNAEKEDTTMKAGKKVQILYLGSLLKSKGPHILLEALKGLDCRCDVYGEGNLKLELQEYIERNALDAEIHPAVPYERIPGLYAAADIVAFPSMWPEPFGRIAIEAQAAGTMIIASDIGAIPEMVISPTWSLVKPGDHHAWHDALATAILQVHEKRKSVERPLAEYGEEAIVGQLLQAYASASRQRDFAF